MRYLPTSTQYLMFVIAMTLSFGCTDQEHSSTVPEPPVAAELDRGHVRLIEKTWPDSVAHLTMNNRWTSADLEAMGINRSNVLWQGEPSGTTCNEATEDQDKCDGQYEPGQIVPFTTRLTEYHRLRRECAEESNEIYRTKDRKCYPELTQVEVVDRDFLTLNEVEVLGPITGGIEGLCKTFGGINLAEIRYGRYCGRDYPDGGVWLDNRGIKGHPIDGVDYCCRLHDASAWAITQGAARHKNVCGFMMCVAQATEFPGGIADSEFSDTLRARQCIWNRATRWVSTCSVKSEFQIAPPPTLAPLPAPPQTRLDRETGQAVQIP